MNFKSKCVIKCNNHTRYQCRLRDVKLSDYYAHVSYTRSPPPPHRALSQRWQRGGNASNNCSVLAKLGINVHFAGTIADNTIESWLVSPLSTLIQWYLPPYHRYS